MKDTNTLLPHVRLDFNIAHPSLEECYIDGYVSARALLEESDNPFSIPVLFYINIRIFSLSKMCFLCQLRLFGKQISMIAPLGLRFPALIDPEWASVINFAM